MEKYLTEANWKATGAKHVPALSKTGVPEALKLYAKADKVALSIAGSQGRTKALDAIAKVTSKALAKFAKRPLLVAELKKVAQAVDNERKAYNYAIDRINIPYAQQDSHAHKMLLQQASTEGSMENITFIESVDKLKPNDLFDRFIARNTKEEVNISGGVYKALKQKREAGTLTTSDFKGAINEVELNVGDTLSRLKPLLKI